MTAKRIPTDTTPRPIYNGRIDADTALEQTPILVVNINGDEVARFRSLFLAGEFINALGLNGHGAPVYFIDDAFTPEELLAMSRG